MRVKPTKVRRLDRQELLRIMKKFVRDNARRHADPAERLCHYCGSRSPKQGCRPGCKARELLWNIERELWLLEVK
jgi:hypothetical protein